MKPRIHIIERNTTSAINGALLSLAAAMLALATPFSCPAQVASHPNPARAAFADVVSPPGGVDSVSRSASEGKTLHVTLGHSIFIDTKTRLRRVYIADPAILSSVTLTPNEIVVTAMTAGVSSLTLLDEAGEAQNYVVSCDVDIDGLRQAIAQTAQGDAIKIEGTQGRVTLSGTVTSQAVADEAVKLAGLYSKEVANAITVAPGHPKQVRLEVRILEVDRSKLLQLGINLFNPGGNSNYVAQTTTSQYPSSLTLSGSGSTPEPARPVFWRPHPIP